MYLNPEFLRNVRIQLTPRRALFAGGLALTLITIVYFLSWSGTEPNPYSPANYNHFKEFGDASFKFLLLAQFILLHVIATSAAGGSMVQERMRGTLIFQQMTLLSPHEMLLGKLFGSTATCYFLAAIVMPFALVSGLIAGIAPNNLALLFLLLIVSGLCFQAIALFISTSIANATENVGKNLMGMGYSIGGLAAIVSLSIFGGLWSKDWTLNDNNLYFYGASLPAFLIVLGMLCFVGGWAYVGAIRAFKDMQLIRLSPRPVWYFFASLEALLVGLFWAGAPAFASNSYVYAIRNEAGAIAYASNETIGFIISYLSINWMALTALVGVTAISRNQLREWWSAEQDAISMLKRSELRNAFLTFPVAVGISMFGLAALWLSLHFKMMSFFYTDPTFSNRLLVVAVLLFAITMAAMAGFIQFWSMFRFKIASRAGVALWVLFFIVAGIAAGIMGETSIPALINPLVVTAIALDNNSLASLAITKGLFVEIVFSLCCLALMYWKWRRTRNELLGSQR